MDATKEKKGEKAKIFVLVLVSIVFVTMGYFRFFHKKTGSAVNQAPNAVPMEQPDFSGVKVDIPRSIRKVVAAEMEIVRPLIRDIFFPEELTPRKKSGPAALPAPPPPSFRLGGTIVGGGEPMAIINDQFLGVGQQLGGYRVVRIGKDDVLLESDDRKILLEMVKE